VNRKHIIKVKRLDSELEKEGTFATLVEGMCVKTGGTDDE
jgi:hypothetical protein